MGKVKALTGEGWGLEVGEGHHLWGSLGQLVSSNISIHKTDFFSVKQIDFCQYQVLCASKTYVLSAKC